MALPLAVGRSVVGSSGGRGKEEGDKVKGLGWWHIRRGLEYQLEFELYPESSWKPPRDLGSVKD